MSTFTVEFPDGTVMEGIPEGTPREAIAARYEQETGRAAPPPSSPQSAPKADGPGFMERSEKRLQMGLSDAMSTLAGDVWNEDATPKHQTPVDVARRVGGGDIGSAVFDVAGDALISAGKEILPAAAQRALGDTMDKAMNLEPVKAGIEAWDKFEKGNPEIARKINETANVAGLLAPTPKTPKVSAQAYGRKSLDTKIKGRSEEVRNILQPDATAAKGHIEEVGALGRNRYVGTQFEEGMYDTVAKVKGVDPRKSYAHNWKALQDESTALRKSLDARLREGGSAVEVDGLKKGLANVANAFGRNPLLAGKADSAANQVYLATKRLIDDATKGKKTIEMDELLQIRRDLDDLAENWIGGMFEDGFSARQMAVKELRNSLNDTVAANAPKGLDVKADLAKQSHILAARDIAHPRMHAQKRNHLTRWLKNLEQATGFSHPTTPLGAAANATSILSAGLTATLAMGYGLHRPMTAAARASYHRALKSIEALQKTGVDQAMLTEGKLAILDILKSNPVADDVEE